MFHSVIGRFRLIGLLEGLSYIMLLFVAMPIKYMLGDPIYVKIIGMTHGVLFMLFILMQIQASMQYRFKAKENLLYFIASLVPFGTFFSDLRLKRIQN